ncbi:MAG: LLM class F420-dependent oxidoreductase [Thermomicrobiales bacterium]
MKTGVVFPQTEIGEDAGGVRAYAQATEDLGYDHILAYDHVLGANEASRPGWSGAYSSESLFHEVFVLFSYIAGFTERVEFVTGVLILPQRQTALVAKQAASLDRLSNGRLRLGIGVGWNEVEYIGLNENFSDRGKRSEEQIAVMRRLWTNDVIEFEGKWHTIPDAGIRPLPVQQPIPVWIGGYVDATLRRVGRIGDGWFPRDQPGDKLRADLETLAEAAREAGRNYEEIGIEGRINLIQLPEREWGPATEAWREIGASHVSVLTMGGGLDPDGHIDLIRRYREVVGND